MTIYHLRISVAELKQWTCVDCGAKPLRAFDHVNAETVRCLPCHFTMARAIVPPAARAEPQAGAPDPVLPPVLSPSGLEVDAALNSGRPFLHNADGVKLHDLAEQAGWRMQPNAPPLTHGYYRNGRERAIVVKDIKGLGLVRIEAATVPPGNSR